MTPAFLTNLRPKLEERGWLVHAPGDASLPDLVCVGEGGLLCVSESRDHGDGVVFLNRQVSNLRQIDPSLSRVMPHRVAVAKEGRSTVGKEVERDLFTVLHLIDHSAPRPLPSEARGALEAHLTRTAVHIDVPSRGDYSDALTADRMAHRVRLDAQQAAGALEPVDDVLVVTGPPGSGKSLVLAARARHLAEAHPDWDIRLLCFNRLLVPYLESLVGDVANVRVQTFGKFSHSLGYRVSLGDELAAKRDVDAIEPLLQHDPQIDALLIDEWQDFASAWTRFALASVRPGRGGTVVAGDPAQALYRDSTPVEGLRGRSLRQLKLQHSYRSTAPVMHVAAALVDRTPTDAESLEGVPVDLVWSHNAAGQADAVAHDVKRLVENGVQPSAIGVLVTRKFLMGKVRGALEEIGVEARSVYADNHGEFSLVEPSVKILTVHSAKGYEFDAVFLVGLEHLPPPDDAPETTREARTGFVGATRARDRLVITYSKSNPYLERVRALPAASIQPWIWPDDFPGAN
ncbi:MULTISPECIES: 3'-5' exonuclease [unclassified Agrococcus]|uniref:3'-5' exonuclease n=1 Tax=unclassified Agrococcus TaxID=2615065 RepID=UPI00360EF571